MLKSFISFLLMTIVITVESQTVQVANLDRLKYKTGVMIFYYGPNRVVKYCSLWDVKFKKEDSEERIGNLLKDKVAAYDPYMYFEFKEGFDCNNAREYLQKKGINNMLISSCTSIDFSENSNGKFNTDGLLGYKPKAEENGYLDELETYASANVRKIIKAENERLLKDGWVRIAGRLQQTNGGDYPILKAFDHNPATTYTIIAGLTRGPGILKLLHNVKGGAVLVSSEKKDNELMMIADYHNDRAFDNKLAVALLPNDKTNSQPGGFLIYGRAVDFKRDFEAVLADAPNGFSNLKRAQNGTNEFGPVYYAPYSFGGLDHEIFNHGELGMIYRQTFNIGSQNAKYSETEIDKVLTQEAFSGKYNIKATKLGNGAVVTQLFEGEKLVFYKIADKNTNLLEYYFLSKDIKKIPYVKADRRTIAELNGKITHIAFSNDSKMFAVSSSEEGSTGQIKIFDTDTETEITTIPGVNSHFAIFAADNKSLYSHINSKGLVQLDIQTGKTIRTLMKDTVGKVLFVADISPDGKTLAAGSFFGEIFLYDLATGKRTAVIKENPDNRLVLRTRFLDNSTLVTAGGDFVKTWDLKTRKAIVTIAPPAGEKKLAVDIATAAKKVFCTYQKNMFVYDALTGKQLSTYDLGNFYAAHFQTNGELVLCSSSEGIYAFNGELKCNPESNGQRFPHQMEMMASDNNKSKVVVVGSNKVMISDYSYFVNMVGVLKEETVKQPATEEPNKNPTKVSPPKQPDFIDNTKNYLFKNWEEAKFKYSWNWLETAADDKNVYRFFFNFSSGFNNPDSLHLSINQKADDYTWTLTKPDANKPVNYTFSAIMGMAENKNSDCGQGLIIQYRDGKKNEPARLYFIINPIKQTYWFGSYSPGKNEWTTHNHYTGNTYNIFTNAINKHSNESKTSTKNTISVKKEANRFLLFINNQLVDTVELNKKNDALRNFEGIGIVTVHKQSSGVDRISLSED
jgi:WD40 repeat protein